MGRMPQEEEAPGGVPEWVVTYGDMMSLLLTFFVLLASLSEVKKDEKFEAIVESLRQRFGYDLSALSLMPGHMPPLNSAMERAATMGRSRRADTLKGGARVRAPVGENPRVRAVGTAKTSTIGGVIFFDELGADLSAENRRILEAIAQEITGKPQRVEIRGHTSSRPLPTDAPWHNHWDLAYARCLVVKDALIGLGIDPRRIRLSVAADNEPRHTGSDPLLRKENPRVEVFLLDELATVAATADEEKPAESAARP